MQIYITQILRTNKLLRRMQARANAPHNTGDNPSAPGADVASLVMLTRRGVAVIVRRVAPGDAAALRAFVGQLSERTRSRRYMTSRPLIDEAARQEASRMARGHTADHVTLIAVDHAVGDIIAVAELVRDAGQPTIGEFALVVRDDVQNDGIGSELLRRLVQMAPQIGLARLRADILAENQPMRALIRKLDLLSTSTYHSGSIEVVWQLAAPGARSANEGALASQTGLMRILPPDQAQSTRR
jgi:RimJ/RimL family protein N-acetyltransferase